MSNKPQYPIYIISKGRYEVNLTAKFFIKDGVDFHLVVEPQEADEYKKRYGEHRVYILPFSNLGKGGTPARNWCWEHAKTNGYKRHWIFDDNIRCIRRLYNGLRILCNANTAMKVIEDFTDRYENIGISGFNYSMFVTKKTNKPYVLNCHVYSALLINNEIPYRWRMRYNEDTDLCLQVVTNKLCTVLFNIFTVDKMRTMTMKGGNSDDLYKNNGRLIMARALEEMWPEHVTTKWRFGRPQHVIKNLWKDFTTPLIRRKDVNWDEIQKKEYNINLIKTQEIKSEEVKKLYIKYHQKLTKN